MNLIQYISNAPARADLFDDYHTLMDWGMKIGEQIANDQPIDMILKAYATCSNEDETAELLIHYFKTKVAHEMMSIIATQYGVMNNNMEEEFIGEMAVGFGCRCHSRYEIATNGYTTKDPRGESFADRWEFGEVKQLESASA